MRLRLENTELLLRENCPLGLVNGRGIAIRCVAGKAWLTEEGEAGDCFLTPGEVHRLKSNGLALLESLGAPATVRLEAACSMRDLPQLLIQKVLRKSSSADRWHPAALR